MSSTKDLFDNLNTLVTALDHRANDIVARIEALEADMGERIAVLGARLAALEARPPSAPVPPTPEPTDPITPDPEDR